MGNLTKNFSRSEFACKCGCGADDISMVLVHRLQAIRDVLGEPMYINSGVRCKEHNAAVGGDSDSEHIPNEDGVGEGADIKCDNSRLRHNLLYYTHEKFVRVGVGPDFIHVGVRVSKPSEVTWTYYTG